MISPHLQPSDFRNGSVHANNCVHKRLCVLLPGVVQGGQVAFVVLLAWAALPGVLTKQFVNCVQLRNAMASLVLHDQQKADTSGSAHIDKQQ